MRYFMISAVMVSLVSATNLVVNGEFEQDLTSGWTESVVGGGIIDRATQYQPDPDYEVQVYKYSSSGSVSLLQNVDIDNTDIDFTCSARMYALDNTVGDWAATAVGLVYLNDANSVLGETRIYRPSDGDCPWVDTPRLHLIYVPDESWHDYTFNIHDELQNLPIIDPNNVAKIQVVLYGEADYCGG